MRIENFLDRLDGVQPNGTGWMARCPAHDDRKASLSIHEGDDGRILLRCFAGCEPSEIVAALDLELRDLFPDSDRPGPAARHETRHELRWEAGAAPVAAHVRVDQGDGTKRFYWQQPDGKPGLGGVRTADLPLYGIDRLNGAAGCIVTEGEKAAVALIRLGLPAVGTVTGASGTPGDTALRPIVEKEVILWPDNDAPGEDHMERIARRLRALGCREVRVVRWTNAPAKGDAADLIAAGGTVAEVGKLLRAAQPYQPAARPLPLTVDDEEGTPLSTQAGPSWPDPPDPCVYHGLAGEIVRAVDPTTEADPMGVLLTLLAAVGAMVGARPHWHVSGTDHPLRIWPVLVGATSKGRKGTAAGAVKPLLRAADPEWMSRNMTTGLSSGEGLIWAVRDPLTKLEPVKEGGQIVRTEEVTVDEGVGDKRLLVVEEEFASTLRLMARDGNSLSGILRQAWGDGDLRTLTKNTPARATGAHIVVVGHTTQDELLRYLDNTEAGNGFANRFLWVCVQRSKLLPDGGQMEAHQRNDLARRLVDALAVAREIDLIERDEEAGELWRAIYGPLSEGGMGLLGAVLSRAEAQVMRLAGLYAVLDGSAFIRAAHLRAAVALWDFIEASARFIFGDKLGDPVADTILAALRGSGPLDRTAISDLFGRNASRSRLDHALGLLLTAGKARRAMDKETGGRAREVWQAT